MTSLLCGGEAGEPSLNRDRYSSRSLIKPALCFPVQHGWIRTQLTSGGTTGGYSISYQVYGAFKLVVGTMYLLDKFSVFYTYPMLGERIIILVLQGVQRWIKAKVYRHVLPASRPNAHQMCPPIPSSGRYDFSGKAYAHCHLLYWRILLLRLEKLLNRMDVLMDNYRVAVRMREN